MPSECDVEPAQWSRRVQTSQRNGVGAAGAASANELVFANDLARAVELAQSSQRAQSSWSRCPARARAVELAQLSRRAQRNWRSRAGCAKARAVQCVKARAVESVSAQSRAGGVEPDPRKSRAVELARKVEL